MSEPLMAKQQQTDNFFTERYPAIADWIETTGWIEFGKDDHSRSMARVLNEGGTVWEGKTRYASIDALFEDVEQALKAELGYEDDDEKEEIIPALSTSRTKSTSPSKENTFVEVESSMIHAVRYNAQTKELDVMYNTGKVWRYEGVGKKEYEGLMKSSSKGSYMRSNIIGCYSEFSVRLGKK